MGLIDNLASRLRARSRAELELDYLNEATSPVDVELRQREIDRGRFRKAPARR
jgi:hypothetical protein